MKAEILCIGTELLMGQIVNTNAAYISKRLPDVGIGVYYQTVVGDNHLRVEECLKLALERCDIVIITGGLGPTKDDLTKEAVANHFKKKLVMDENSLKHIEEFFISIGREMTENNKRQALFPEGSIILDNPNGTAPGCLINENGKMVFMLPGPPKEMIPMFENSVMKKLDEKLDWKLESRFLKVFGIGESSMETLLMDLIENQLNPTVAPYAKEGEVTLRVTAKCQKNSNADVLLLPLIQEIENRLGNYLYSKNGESLEAVAMKLLLERNKTVSFAESCTGGLISGTLTALSGSSKVLKSSYVTYSNSSKISDLGVKGETLDNFGAVSGETVIEMAIGAREKSNSDIALAVSGIAGPDGGTDEKPVGLVYIAICGENGIVTKKLNIHGDRNRVRNLTVLNAFDMIRRYLIN